MPLDVDYVFADEAIKRLKKMLSNVEHGEREEIADDIIDFVDKMEEKWEKKEEKEVKEIQCHGGTPKQDLLDFVELHKGKKIEIHYEANLYQGWGDDDFFTYDTSTRPHYLEIIDTIETHYIHGIKLVDNGEED